MNASAARNSDCTENRVISGFMRVVATAITDVKSIMTAHRSTRLPEMKSSI